MTELLLRATIDQLHEAVAKARAELISCPEATWVAASVQVPAGRHETLLDLRITDETIYFCAGAGSSAADSSQRSNVKTPVIVGLGAAQRLRFTGQARFRDAARTLPSVFSRLRASDEEHESLRFFGGGAFSAGSERPLGCWDEFGDASFILPRFTYADSGSDAQLILLVERDGAASDLALGEQILSTIFDDRLANYPPRSEMLTEIARRESVGIEQWSDLIANVHAHIASGEVQKVVAARRTTLQLSEEPRLSSVVHNLNEQAPLCTRFALRLGKKTFLGATPERLIRKQGAEVSTEALAGSIDASHPNAQRELLSSKKDRAEHEYVVRAIENVLESRCFKLEFLKEPEVRSLQRILHLRTPMTGELKEDTSLLTLVDELHPTPAVGGVPRSEALDWILNNESTPRGWYASPFGWLNKAGNGEFVVALRSALIHGDRVHLYAGAGIVEQSDAQAEFEETALKLMGMVGALGLTG